MRRVLPALACAAVFGLSVLAGCHREEQPKPHTLSDIQAQIDKVKSDPNMPANVKPMVLGMLEGEKQRLQKQAAN